FFIVVAIVVIALVTSLVSGRARLRADWPAGLWGLAVPWLFLPPALLVTVSVIHVTHPVYVFRYIAFCIPAAALLAGTALAALARLHDSSQARAPVAAGTLGGTFARPSVENHRLATVTRLWVASWSKAPAALPPRFGFTVAYTLHAKGVWLRLYTRPHTAATG